MKPIATLLFLFLSCFFAKGQTTFAPAGAEWYHSMAYGAFHCYNAGTTTVAGKTCSTILQIAQTAQPWKSMGLTVSNLGTLNTYTSGDTVFVYNNTFSQFTPLYVFNVSEGDTVCLPNFYGNMSPPSDPTFCFRVDSVRMVLYDTALLKTVYTHSYEYHSMWIGDDTVISSYGHNEYGAYAERLGGVISGIYPQCLTCPVVLSESYQRPGAVRCYNDADYSLKMVTGICGIPTSVNEIVVGDISIFPNPAVEQLHINVGKAATIQLMTIDGKRIMEITTDKNGIAVVDVKAIPAGMYFVRVSGDGGVFHKRVFIGH